MAANPSPYPPVSGLSNPVTVAQGGTGGTTAITARSGLAVMDPQPADFGMIGWAYDPSAAASASNAQTSGTISAVRLRVPAGTITNIILGINSAGTNLVSGQNFAGLYSSDGSTLLSATADQTTNWTNTSFAAVTMALTTPQTVAAGYVYVAWYANNSGGSNPKWQWANSANMVNATLTNSTARFGRGGTGATTALPASLTLTTSGDTYWCAVS